MPSVSLTRENVKKRGRGKPKFSSITAALLPICAVEIFALPVFGMTSPMLRTFAYSAFFSDSDAGAAAAGAAAAGAGASSASFASGAGALLSPCGSASDDVQRVWLFSSAFCSASNQQCRWGYQVISQQLHDEGRILVAFLTQGIKLGNGVIKSLFGQMAGLIRRIQDLVVENGEVKRKAKTDWVGRSKVGLGNFGGILVSLEGLVGGPLALVAESEFGQITVIITLPRND